MFLIVPLLGLSGTFSRLLSFLWSENRSRASRRIRPVGSVPSVSRMVPMFIARILLARLGQAFVGSAMLSQVSQVSRRCRVVVLLIPSSWTLYLFVRVASIGSGVFIATKTVLISFVPSRVVVLLQPRPITSITPLPRLQVDKTRCVPRLELDLLVLTSIASLRRLLTDRTLELVCIIIR